MEIRLSTFVPKCNLDPFAILTFMYKLMYFTCGYDFGFVRFKSDRRDVCRKIWTVIQCLILCLTISAYVESLQRISCYRRLYNTLQYFVFVVLLALVDKGATFFDLFDDCKEIDLKLGTNKDYYNAEGKLLQVLAVCFTIRSLIFCSYYFLLGNDLSEAYFIAILYYIQQTFQTCIMISYAFMFHSIKCRLEYLIVILELRRTNFDFLQIMYRRLFDVTEKYKRAFDPLFMATLLFYTPSVMSTIYYTIVNAMQGGYDSTFPILVLLEWIYVFWYLTLLFMPPLCASMLSSRGNKIRIILHDILLDYSDGDERTRSEISRFLEYVRVRPFQFTVYKLVPLNEQLLGMVLQFCVTYLIVIIQFTVKA